MMHFVQIIFMQLKDITKEVVTIAANTPFNEAVALMVEKKTNVLLVVDSEGILTGVVSVTDLLDAVVPEYLDGDSTAAHFASEDMFKKAVTETKDQPVSNFMSTELTTVSVNESLMAVAVTAIASKRLRIPVVDEAGRPVGIISRQGLKRILAGQLGIEDSR
jgi:CBS domain-containing protein